MVDAPKVKVFVSWSGDVAKEIAVAFRDWLPDIFDNVSPWASDTDIEAGSRSLDEIHAALVDSSVGVIMVTQENQNAAWLNYEAGALAKTISPMRARVIPLLVDIDSPTQLTGPIAQFQAKRLDQSGVADVLGVIGSLAGVEPATIERRFGTMWASLDEKLQEARAKASPRGAQSQRRTQSDMLEEVLSHVRVLREAQSANPAVPPINAAMRTLEREAEKRGIRAKASPARKTDGTRIILLRENVPPWDTSPSAAALGLADEVSADFGVQVTVTANKTDEAPF